MFSKKINIDEYSIATIIRYVSYNNADSLRIFRYEKYAIINNKEINDEWDYRKYKQDLLTGEKYYLNSDYFDQINTLYIYSKERLIPLSHVIESDNGKMRKKEFLKQCRKIIIALNEKSLDGNQKQVIDKVKNKEKMLKLGNSKITYKEEE